MVRKIDVEEGIVTDNGAPEGFFYPRYSCAECKESFVDKNNGYFVREDGLYEKI